MKLKWPEIVVANFSAISTTKEISFTLNKRSYIHASRWSKVQAVNRYEAIF